MGNTISASPNILFLIDPIITSRNRFLDRAGAVRCDFESKQLPNRYYQARLPEKARLRCYEVALENPSSRLGMEMLMNLCFELRVDEEQNGRDGKLGSKEHERGATTKQCPAMSDRKKINEDGIEGWRLEANEDKSMKQHKYSGPLWERGWKPRSLFYIQGDFGNDGYNAVLSVLFEKIEKHTTKSGDEVTTGSHSFIHIYESGHLAQGFEEILREMEDVGGLREVCAKVSEADLNILEAYALFWARSRWQSVMWEGGEDITRRFEHRLWDVWYTSCSERRDSVFLEKLE